MRSRLAHRHQLKQSGIKGMFGRLSFAVVVLVICTVSLLSTINSTTRPLHRPEELTWIHSGVELLLVGGDHLLLQDLIGPLLQPKPMATYEYVVMVGSISKEVRYGTKSCLYIVITAYSPCLRDALALKQICNAVLAARIMNATLVLPELDANSFWHDDSGFHGVYDVEHFIESLRYDVKIVESIPEIQKKGKTKKIKAFQMRPPRDAPISWYTTDALKKMKEHGAIYLTPFSHRLAEEIDNPEYQRLRCRVNYHALRFKPHIMELSNSLVNKLRAQGHFMAIHLRFEMDMLAFAGCFDIFNSEEQKVLKKYRDENFAPKKLIYSERRAIGKCPLTPEEVGLILRAMGFDNSTRIYLAAGELFGGERFMKPFQSLFPRLENHKTVDPTGELTKNTNGLVGSAVDYMVCLLADIFMPTYDGPSNFANNLLGHRLYYGFRTNIQPDRKALAPIFIDREKEQTAGFEESVRRVMQIANFGGPHKRVSPESFYTNSWPECFCHISADPPDRCPPNNVLETLESQLGTRAIDDSGSLTSNSTVGRRYI
ncbi:GDP-fucose protein O-fucosyltransferase 1 [Orobanche hederae]